ncbi:MAG: NAD(P)/FAD-dependent oxidoreductase [Patescibacteria group bacterium]
MIGQSYLLFKPKSQDAKKFDAIVIGSGTGGLSAASMLAQEGKRVLVLEKHFTIGGYTHAFQRKGYTWDVGLHYVGQVHLPGTLLNKTFRYISKNHLKWEPLDDVYDRVVFGDTEYEFPRGRQNFKNKLKEYFPEDEDKKSIDGYFDLLDTVQKIGPGYFVEKILPPFLAKIFGPLLRRRVLHFSDQTTLSVLKKITKNKKLIGVLTAEYGDYGLPPSRSSFYMHAVLANHYMDGAAYPVGGASKFAETVTAVIEEAGGIALASAKVKEIIVKNNKAVGVEMEDGKKFFAKKIISDAGIRNTFLSLLPKEVIDEHGFREQLKKLEPSSAHMGLYVGIRKSNKELHLPKCNYWIFPDEYDHELSQKRYINFDSTLPVAFVSFPSAKDPEQDKTHPGRTTAEVIILVPFDWFQKWSKAAPGERGDAYQKMKENMAKQMFQELYRVAPQIKGKVDYYEVSSPLTTRFFSGHPKGEIYGVAHTPARFRQEFLKPYTPVKNLFLTGQDAMIASISGGVMAGVLCASAILKKNLLCKIKRTIKDKINA